MEACPGKLEYLDTATCLPNLKFHSKRGRDITVQAESSAEARRVVMQIIPGATVTGAHRARWEFRKQSSSPRR